MRKKRNDDAWLDFAPMDPEEIEKLEIMAKILKSADGLLDLLTIDLTEDVNPDLGREGMSAEQVLRMAIVKQMYGWSYKQLYSRVHDSIALRKFCGYEFTWVPKPQTLCENIKKIQPETFEAVNKALVKYARKAGIDDGLKVRIDTTTVETNIHHPTDSSLIRDGVVVITRMLHSARKIFPAAEISFHDRTRVVKKRVFNIANAKNDTQRLGPYQELIGFGKEVLGYARSATKKLQAIDGTQDIRTAARLVGTQLKEAAALLAKVIKQTKQRVIKGRHVPADEKVTSFFEPHTDIIEKGGRETVFGHKVCVTVGKGNLVLDAMIEPGNPADTEFFQAALDRHRKLYGYAPQSTAADGGFASKANAEYALSKGVVNVSFSKRVGKTLDELLPVPAVQKLLRKFRAGVEGIISALKRGVGLGRCLWKGWESFQSYVWSSIVAHNLKMLTATMFTRRRRRPARA